MKKHCCLCKNYTSKICSTSCRTGSEFAYSEEAFQIFDEIKKDITDKLNLTDETETEIIEMVNDTVGKLM